MNNRLGSLSGLILELQATQPALVNYHIMLRGLAERVMICDDI